MRIAVVTVHDSANCGSFLQAYALKNILENDGHSVYFVRTRNAEYVRSLYYSFKLSGEWIKHPISCLRRYMYGKRKYRLYCNEGRCFETRDTFSEDTDVTVLGSDEIWNVKTPVFNNPIFYGEGAKNTVAYAVSSGLAKPSDFEGKDRLKELIKAIDLPLVRDEGTAQCVNAITQKTPEIVCDPTLAADREIFLNPCSDKYLKRHKYVLIYAYEPPKAARKIFKEYARKNGLKLVSAGFGYDWCDYNVMCSPLELSSVMKNAECVITTTFHGTVFSVLNRKKFVCIPLSGKTTDILSRLGLEQRQLAFKDLTINALADKITEDIDYKSVDKKIDDMKEKSLALLRELIEKIKGDKK